MSPRRVAYESEMQFRRFVRNVAWFLLAFTLTLLAGVSYASTATSPYGTLTFTGNTCIELRGAVSRAFYTSFPSDPSGYEWLQCNVGTFAAGNSVNVYFKGRKNADGVYALSGTTSVTIQTVDSTPDPDAPDPNEKGYMAWIGMAICCGLGILTGLQR